MKSKWYLCTLIVILGLLGYSQQQAYVPNQEIVVRFSDSAVTFEETQNAIAVVKKQLLEAGIDNVQVREAVDGSLKITYYSDIDVTGIQQLFAKEKSIFLGSVVYNQNENNSDFPFDQGSDYYQLKVSEIHNTFDSESNFKAHKLELTHENELLNFPIVYFSVSEINSEEQNNSHKTAYKLHRNIALAIDRNSHNIPEVRAGPVAIGNA